MPTVREATFDLFREQGMTTIFGNPGSTEVPFLGGLPDDFEFVLALHEGPLVAMASGYAIARGEPAFVLVHAAAGLGNAVNALVTARVNRAPLGTLRAMYDNERKNALTPLAMPQKVPPLMSRTASSGSSTK